MRFFPCFVRCPDERLSIVDAVPVAAVVEVAGPVIEVAIHAMFEVGPEAAKSAA